MELLANRPVIRVRVNGLGPFAWLVAPEGEATLIDQSLATELKLTGQTDRATSPQFEVEMELGEKRLTKVQARATDMVRLVPELGGAAGLRGVIGASLWPSRLVTLDYSRFQLKVEPGSLPEPNRQDVFALKADSPEIGLTIAAAGRSISCQLDPLFPGGLLLPGKYATQLPLVGQPAEIAPMDTANGRVRVRQAQLAVDVTLGMFEFARPRVWFAESGDQCIIGGQRLIGFSVTYDLSNARVRLARQLAR